MVPIPSILYLYIPGTGISNAMDVWALLVLVWIISLVPVSPAELPPPGPLDFNQYQYWYHGGAETQYQYWYELPYRYRHWEKFHTRRIPIPEEYRYQKNTNTRRIPIPEEYRYQYQKNTDTNTRRITIPEEYQYQKNTDTNTRRIPIPEEYR